MEQTYLLPARIRDALLHYFLSQVPMSIGEAPVNDLRSLEPPKTSDERDFSDLMERVIDAERLEWKGRTFTLKESFPALVVSNS